MVMELLTTKKILEFVFGAIVGKVTEGTIAKLWQLIRQRLQKEPVAEAIILEIEQNHSRDSLQKLVPFLDVEMIKDPQFKQEIETLAQQINNSSQDTITQKGKSFGQSTFNQIGKINNANTINF